LRRNERERLTRRGRGNAASLKLLNGVLSSGRLIMDEPTGDGYLLADGKFPAHRRKKEKKTGGTGMSSMRVFK